MSGGAIWAPQPGRAWNPLRAFPPNAHCFCGSGRKAKKCCLHRLSWTVPQGEADKLAKAMREKGAALRVEVIKDDAPKNADQT